MVIVVVHLEESLEQLSFWCNMATSYDFWRQKKPDPNSHSDFHNDELDVPYYDDDDDDYDPIMFNDDYVDEPFGDSYDSYSNGPIGNSYTPSSSLAVGQGQK